MFKDPSFPNAWNVSKTVSLEPESNKLRWSKNSQKRKSIYVHNGTLQIKNVTKVITYKLQTCVCGMYWAVVSNSLKKVLMM